MLFEFELEFCVTETLVPLILERSVSCELSKGDVCGVEVWSASDEVSVVLEMSVEEDRGFDEEIASLDVGCSTVLAVPLFGGVGFPNEDDIELKFGVVEELVILLLGDSDAGNEEVAVLETCGETLAVLAVLVDVTVGEELVVLAMLFEAVVET
jgi:hypothetical protein